MLQKLSLFALFSFSTFFISAQEFDAYNKRNLELSKRSMLVLSSWGTTNIISGGFGFYSTEQSSRYFHQMNMMWNTVNLALGATGYIRAVRNNYNLSWQNQLKEQYKTEKILLFNSALDLGYIGSGLFLNYRSNSLQGQDVWVNRGYGNSLIVQGSFLLVFDVVVYLLHRKNRLKNFEPVLLKL